jgi:hypothetical protein
MSTLPTDDVSDIGVRYTQNVDSTLTSNALESLLVELNQDGSETYFVCSATTPVLYSLASNNGIVWSHEFTPDNCGSTKALALQAMIQERYLSKLNPHFAYNGHRYQIHHR